MSSSRRSAALSLTLAAASASAQIPESADPERIPHYSWISPKLAAAGQPSAEALASLEELGFKTVVNLRAAGEDFVAEEKGVVEAQGLRYVHVPVTPGSFSLADVAAVEKVLDDPDSGPVLLHCASSNRVGGVWAVIEARRGRSLEQALEAGKAAGLRSAAMQEAVERLLAEQP